MTLADSIGELGRELGFRTNLTVIILTMSLLLARLLPVMVASPFIGGEAIPTELKVGIGVTFGLVMFPAVAERMTNIPVSPLPYIALLAKELFVGLTIAFAVNAVFDAAEAAGHMMDHSAGTSMAQVMVPQLQQQVPLFSAMQTQLSVVLFLTINGHHLVIEALADSLLTVPLDEFPRLSSGTWALFEHVLHIFADLLKVATALAAPAIVTSFLTDIALGMINRVAPQVQVFFISMQIKPTVVALVMFFAVHGVFARIIEEYGVMVHFVRDVIKLLG